MYLSDYWKYLHFKKRIYLLMYLWLLEKYILKYKYIVVSCVLMWGMRDFFSKNERSNCNICNFIFGCCFRNQNEKKPDLTFFFLFLPSSKISFRKDSVWHIPWPSYKEVHSVAEPISWWGPRFEQSSRGPQGAKKEDLRYHQCTGRHPSH